MESFKTIPIVVDTGKYVFHVSRNVKVFHRAAQVILSPESEREVITEFKRKGYEKPMVKVDMKKIKLRRI